MSALSESCRLVQGSSNAWMFRSGAANDEFDGLARYSRHKDGRKLNLGGTARILREARPIHMGTLLYFFIKILPPSMFTNPGSKTCKRVSINMFETAYGNLFKEE